MKVAQTLSVATAIPEPFHRELSKLQEPLLPHVCVCVCGESLGVPSPRRHLPAGWSMYWAFVRYARRAPQSMFCSIIVVYFSKGRGVDALSGDTAPELTLNRSQPFLLGTIERPVLAERTLCRSISRSVVQARSSSGRKCPNFGRVRPTSPLWPEAAGSDRLPSDTGNISANVGQGSIKFGLSSAKFDEHLARTRPTGARTRPNSARIGSDVFQIRPWLGQL